MYHPAIVNRALRHLLLATALLFGLGARAPEAGATWPSDPTVNLPMCDDPARQIRSRIISDGAGGQIVAWDDFRTPKGIYAQSIAADGTLRWAPNGVMVVPISNLVLSELSMCSDGAGGAIIAFQKRNFGTDIYAQRIDASGTVRWTPGGVELCGLNSDQVKTAVVEDGTGGAIVAWQDKRNGLDDVYVRRIDSDGIAQWTNDGVPLCMCPDMQFSIRLCSDGVGGAIAVWTDNRQNPNKDIYAGGITAAGTVAWVDAVCGEPQDQESPAIVSDGAGGAFISWTDRRGFPNDFGDIYAQRMDGSGTALWTPSGSPICTAANTSELSSITQDGDGGAIIAWMDQRTVVNEPDIFAQRVDGAGGIVWPEDGVALCTAAWRQEFPLVVPDGAGGAIVVWSDARDCAPGGLCDLYARRVSASGTPLWDPDGVAICLADGRQYDQVAVANGQGGAVVAWTDYRSEPEDTGGDIYAQAVDQNGQLGGGTTAIPAEPAPAAGTSLRVFPNPMRFSGSIAYRLKEPKAVELRVYEVGGRLVRTLAAAVQAAGEHRMSWEGTDAAGRALPSGVYMIALESGHEKLEERLIILR
jgi:hypothetical protein